jgi:lipopolysaccharide transport protein LptA
MSLARCNADRLLAAGILFLHTGLAGAADAFTATADSLTLDRSTGVQTLRGKVRIQRGEVLITGEIVQVTIVNDAISRILGQGAPIRFTQQLGNGVVVQTQSRKIDYVTRSWTLQFSGDVILHRSHWQVRAPEITYNLRNRNFTASARSSASSRDDGRVTFTYHP